jgi:Zn-dependent peptidase ImmA (M78 family)
MEELSHHLLGHRPCKIAVDAATGCLRRSFDASQEAEAYDLGSAILLPKERIQRDVGRQTPAIEIADAHQCSADLVVYRIKRMRLWHRYSRYAA